MIVCKMELLTKLLERYIGMNKSCNIVREGAKEE
jgi:hypothetical protein